MVTQKDKAKASSSIVREGDFKFDSDVYHKVSCSAALQELRLVSSKFMMKPELFLSEDDTDSSKSLFRGNSESVTIDSDGGQVAGRYIWEAELKFGRSTGLKLRAEYFLVYSGVAGLDAGHTSMYFDRVGRFSTYPYFRSHFSNHVTEAGLMLPPLPSLNERVD
jgi:hypothetical protein